MVAATASASAGHIRKRPYQPSITSYFETDSSGQLQRARSPLSPPLPEDTQASLISVGMRVRKSVPEGYKTHKTLFTPPNPAASTGPKSRRQPKARVLSNTGPAMELTPFCGLHKVGGLGMQDIPTASAPAIMQGGYYEDDDDEYDEDEFQGMPGLSMSQTTMSSGHGSFTSTAGPSLKRTFDDDIEADMDAFFDEVEAAEAVGERQPPAGRPIARMRSTAPANAALYGRSVKVDEDFEDASFLAPMDVDDGAF